MSTLGAPRKSLKKIKDETDYYGHQTEGIRLMARMSSFLLADAMGLGKTIQALTVAAIDWEMNLASRGIIVAPATLKWNWLDEINLHTHFSALVLDGTPRQRQRILSEFRHGDFDWLIVNYEQVQGHLAEFNEFNFDIGIFDEAHYIKNRKSKRTKACHKLRLDRSFVLTGSPVLNNVIELWALLHRIDPARFDNYYRFVNRYAVFGGYKDKEVVGLKNLAELNEILGQYMIRRLKKDVLDLPEKQRIPIRVNLSPQQALYYKEAVKELKIQLPDGVTTSAGLSALEMDNGMVKMLRLKQICGTLATLPGLEDDSAKLDAAEQIVKEAIHDEPDSPGEPVVIFTQFRDVQRCMVDRINKMENAPPVYVINGDTPKQDRSNMVKAWAENERPGVLVAMIQVAGTGLNMTAANKCIFLDKLYVPKLNEQAEDRLHRIGANLTKPVQIYEIICRNTIEQRIESILKRKEKLFNSLVEETDWKRALYEAMMEEETEHDVE